MSKERLTIDQALCDLVRYVLQGGANVQRAAKMTGASAATISRIRAAGFSADRYMENTKQRLKDERIQKRLEAQEMPSLKSFYTEETMRSVPEELPGQMRMELPAEEQKPEMSEQTKMMRFQAAQVDKLYMMMSRINDNLCQLLRAIRKE